MSGWRQHDEALLIGGDKRRREDDDGDEEQAQSPFDKSQMRALWRMPLSFMSTVIAPSRQAWLLEKFQHPWWSIEEGEFPGTSSEWKMLQEYRSSLQGDKRNWSVNADRRKVNHMALPLDPVLRIDAVIKEFRGGDVASPPGSRSLDRKMTRGAEKLDGLFSDSGELGVPMIPFIDTVECHVDAYELWKNLDWPIQAFLLDFKLNESAHIKRGFSYRDGGPRYLGNKLTNVGAAVLLNELCHIGREHGLSDRRTPLIVYHGIDEPTGPAPFNNNWAFRTGLSTSLNPRIGLDVYGVSKGRRCLKINIPYGSPFFNFNFRVYEWSTPLLEEELYLPFSATRLTQPSIYPEDQVAQLAPLISSMSNNPAQENRLMKVLSENPVFYRKLNEFRNPYNTGPSGFSDVVELSMVANVVVFDYRTQQ